MRHFTELHDMITSLHLNDDSLSWISCEHPMSGDVFVIPDYLITYSGCLLSFSSQRNSRHKRECSRRGETACI